MSKAHLHQINMFSSRLTSDVTFHSDKITEQLMLLFSRVIVRCKDSVSGLEF